MQLAAFANSLNDLLVQIKKNEGHRRQRRHNQQFIRLLDKAQMTSNRKLRKKLTLIQERLGKEISPELHTFINVYLQEMSENMSYRKYMNMCSYITYEKRQLLFVAFRKYFPETIDGSVRTTTITFKGVEGRAMKSKRRRKEDPSYSHTIKVPLGFIQRELKFKGPRLRGDLKASHYDPETGVTLMEKAPLKDILRDYGPFRSYTFKYLVHLTSAWQGKNFLIQKNKVRRRRVVKLEENHGVNWSLIKSFVEKVIHRDLIPMDAQNQKRTNKVMTIAFKTLKKKAYQGMEKLIVSKDPTDQVLAKDMAKKFAKDVEQATLKWRSL